MEHARAVIIGGEAAQPQALLRWQSRVPARVRLINTYGPTETTVSVTHADLAQADANEARRPAVSLGRVNAGARACILDAFGMPLPRGVFGELAIGGATVARGYCGLPALTAQRFVPDPGGSRSSRVQPSIPELGQIPYRVFALLLLVFATAIGPVNFLWVARSRKPVRLLLTIPAIALATSLLLLWADEDRMHPLAIAEEALELFPHAQLRVLEGTGFLMAYDDPVGLARELKAFCV